MRALVFIFKYLQNGKKVWLCSFITFSYYLFWTFLQNFSRKFWLAHELLWFCHRRAEKLKKKISIQKKLFFETTFFAKYFNYIWLMSKYDFFSTEITFSDWYLKINILGKGILLFFLSESMELTSDRFFYLLCKTICFYLFIFFFL